jgi:hypothetical protein
MLNPYMEKAPPDNPRLMVDFMRARKKIFVKP